MRDTEARDRVAALEKTLEDLPQQIADIVIKHFESTFKQVNETLDVMRDVSHQLEELTERVDGIGKTATDTAGFMNILEEDITSIRGDLNGAHSAATQAVDAVKAVKGTLRAFAAAVADVA